jgi:hypothetical protein
MALADVQAVLARLFADPVFRADFMADPTTVGRALGLAPNDVDVLAGLSRAAVEQFAATLKRKRCDEVRKALPLTAAALGNGLALYLLKGIDVPHRDRRRDDTSALVDVLHRLSRAGVLEPRWAADIARYEATFARALGSRFYLRVRAFRFPVGRLAVALSRGARPDNVASRPTVGIWLRWPGGGGVLHWVW